MYARPYQDTVEQGLDYNDEKRLEIQIILSIASFYRISARLEAIPF
jgi:hypothetical protein